MLLSRQVAPTPSRAPRLLEAVKAVNLPRFPHPSSRRRPGPIITRCNCIARWSLSFVSNNLGRGVWVPAFAGTTLRANLLAPLLRQLRQRAAFAIAGVLEVDPVMRVDPRQRDAVAQAQHLYED